jgi:hypothetical protein
MPAFASSQLSADALEFPIEVGSATKRAAVPGRRPGERRLPFWEVGFSEWEVLFRA